jgi:hypothetical protein
VDRVAYESGWSESIADDGTPLRWRTHDSPYDPAVDAANRAAAASTNVNLRAQLRVAIRESQTNLVDVLAIRDSQTNIIAQAQAVIWGNSYNRAATSNAWKIVVNHMQETRKAAGEQADATRELIDLLRWQRDQIGDRTPEGTP